MDWLVKDKGKGKGQGQGLSPEEVDELQGLEAKLLTLSGSLGAQ